MLNLLTENDVISDETELKTLLEHQLDLSKDIKRKEYIARMCNEIIFIKRTTERCLFLFERWDVLNDVSVKLS